MNRIEAEPGAWRPLHLQAQGDCAFLDAGLRAFQAKRDGTQMHALLRKLLERDFFLGRP